jgi:hypothetical protein
MDSFWTFRANIDQTDHCGTLTLTASEASSIFKSQHLIPAWLAMFILPLQNYPPAEITVD